MENDKVNFIQNKMLADCKPATTENQYENQPIEDT